MVAVRWKRSSREAVGHVHGPARSRFHATYGTCDCHRLVSSPRMFLACSHFLALSISYLQAKSLCVGFNRLVLCRLDNEGRFVTGSYDKQLITWNIKSSEPEAIMQGQRVTDLAVSRDGRHLIIITPDKQVKIFALPTMSLLPKSIPHQVNHVFSFHLTRQDHGLLIMAYLFLDYSAGCRYRKHNVSQYQP